MDILDSIFENKKQLYIIGAIYLLIAISVLIFIWKPQDKTKTDIVQYSEYNEESKNNEMANYYFHCLLNDFDSVIENKISREYLIYNNTTVEKIKEKYNIDENSVIDGLTIYNSGNYVIYSSIVNYIGGSGTINIIESYPYQYEITFDDFISYESDYDVYNSNGIVITLNSAYSGKNHVIYDFKITNNKNEYINFDFSNTESVYLLTEDGQKHYLANNSLESTDANITQNGMINKKLVFPISINVQGNVESLNFDDVSIDGKKVNISFEI